MLLSLILGVIAAFADMLGGMILVRRQWEQRYLRYFVALGAGFMLSVAFLEMVPESLRFSLRWSPVLVLAGYCAIHLLEHTITPHFHFGEETHAHEFVSAHTGNSVLAGLAAHALFDGVAIGSGFVLSNLLGWLIFFAIFLHKMPEGFTVASVMMASGRSRRTAMISAIVLAFATVLGVLLISLLPGWVQVGLPLSAGVAIYVAATDLVPEVNREPGIRMALVFFAGVRALPDFEAAGAGNLRLAFHSLSFPPHLVQTPCSQSACVLNGSVHEHPLEFGYGRGLQYQIVLFGIGIGPGLRQSRRQIDVLFLLRKTIGDPHRPKANHGRGNQSGLFPQFSASQIFGIDIGDFPTSLRQLERSPLDGVTELLDEVDGVAFDGQNHCAIVFINNTVDALLSITALDLVFANTKPGIAIDLAAAQSANAHRNDATLSWPTTIATSTF